MKYKEIQAKTLLNKLKYPDSWFGVQYTINIYKGCNFQCIYCDSRSECYRIDDFNDIEIKINADEILYSELRKKRNKNTIAIGAMSDSYNCADQKYKLTSKCLNIIAEAGFPLHLRTKSNRIVEDINILKKVETNGLSTAFSVSTTDDTLAKIIEPGASVPSERFKAMKTLSDAGLYTGIIMMPILPFIEDTMENIKEIVQKTKENGGQFIVPWLGVTLRDRQKIFYFNKLDEHFPGMRKKYENYYKNTYDCRCVNEKELYKYFSALCEGLKIQYKPSEINKFDQAEQLSLF